MAVEVPQIILFEDQSDTRELICKRIKEASKSVKESHPFEIVSFAFEEENHKCEDKESYVDCILRVIEQHYRKIHLFVIDNQLHETNQFRGLNDTTVIEVAERLGIPYCLYGNVISDRTKEPWKEWGYRRILLQFGDSLGEEVVKVFNGFETLIDKIDINIEDPSPARILCTAIGMDGSPSRVNLYEKGAHTQLGGLEYVYSEKDIDIRRLGKMLGEWLWSSLLRYPGVFVNEIAAASYLNIELEKFQESEVQSYFSAAKYSGPFSDLSPFWWRHELDIILAESNVGDGKELLDAEGIAVNDCYCEFSEEDAHPAGFLCIYRNRPVCSKHSTGNLAWFPSGADLARFNKEEFYTLEPYLSY